MALRWTAGNETEYDYNAPRNADGSVARVPRPTYGGAVLGKSSRDARLMSDVYGTVYSARVWDGTEVRNVEYGTDEFGTYATVEVDATPDVLAAVAAYEAARGAALLEAARVAAEARRLAEASRVAKYKNVVVVRGRKVAKGTTGRVFWHGATQYGTRVGLELADGSRVFTAASNVEVANPAEYLNAA